MVVCVFGESRLEVACIGVTSRYAGDGRIDGNTVTFTTRLPVESRWWAKSSSQPNFLRSGPGFETESMWDDCEWVGTVEGGRLRGTWTSANGLSGRWAATQVQRPHRLVRPTTGPEAKWDARLNCASITATRGSTGSK